MTGAERYKAEFYYPLDNFALKMYMDTWLKKGMHHE